MNIANLVLIKDKSHNIYLAYEYSPNNTHSSNTNLPSGDKILLLVHNNGIVNFDFQICHRIHNLNIDPSGSELLFIVAKSHNNHNNFLCYLLQRSNGKCNILYFFATPKQRVHNNEVKYSESYYIIDVFFFNWNSSLSPTSDYERCNYYHILLNYSDKPIDNNCIRGIQNFFYDSNKVKNLPSRFTRLSHDDYSYVHQNSLLYLYKYVEYLSSSYEHDFPSISGKNLRSSYEHDFPSISGKNKKASFLRDTNSDKKLQPPGYFISNDDFPSLQSSTTSLSTILPSTISSPIVPSPSTIPSYVSPIVTSISTSIPNIRQQTEVVISGLKNSLVEEYFRRNIKVEITISDNNEKVFHLTYTSKRVPKNIIFHIQDRITERNVFRIKDDNFIEELSNQVGLPISSVYSIRHTTLMNIAMYTGSIVDKYIYDFLRMLDTNSPTRRGNMRVSLDNAHIIDIIKEFSVIYKVHPFTAYNKILKKYQSDANFRNEMNLRNFNRDVTGLQEYINLGYPKLNRYQELMRIKQVNNQIKEALRIDDFSSPEYEKAKQKNASESEFLFSNLFRELGIELYTENDILQSEYCITGGLCISPDIYFKSKVILNNVEVKWLEYKSYFCTGNGFLHNKNIKQFRKYRDNLGPGAVFYLCEIAEDVQCGDINFYSLTS